MSQVHVKVGNVKHKIPCGDGGTTNFLPYGGYHHRFHVRPLSAFLTMPVVITTLPGHGQWKAGMLRFNGLRGITRLQGLLIYPVFIVEFTPPAYTACNITNSLPVKPAADAFGRTLCAKLVR